MSAGTFGARIPLLRNRWLRNLGMISFEFFLAFPCILEKSAKPFED